MLLGLRRVGRRAGFSTFANNHDVKAKLRLLLRETAQPVAVITSLLPLPDKPSSTLHGATLSSFSSIAMDPYPLVAFSLKIPSRMAASLRGSQPELASDMVINILSAAQASIAVLFSRPDLHPYPFEKVEYSLNDEGIPILKHSLGALSCKLASPPIPLDGLGKNLTRESRSEDTEGEARTSSYTSELFIARVTKVERLALEDAEANDPQAMPLLYHRRDYSTCSLESLLRRPRA